MKISKDLPSSDKIRFPAIIISLSIILGVLLSGCVMTGESDQIVVESNAPQPTQTTTLKPLDTVTPTSTNTPKPTHTITPSITSSPTSVFSNVSVYSVGWIKSGHLLVTLNIPGIPDDDYYTTIGGFLHHSCRLYENQSYNLLCVGSPYTMNEDHLIDLSLKLDREYQFVLYNSMDEEVFNTRIYVTCSPNYYPDYEGKTNKLNACCPSGSVFWGLPYNKCCPLFEGCD